MKNKLFINPLLFVFILPTIMCAESKARNISQFQKSVILPSKEIIPHGSVHSYDQSLNRYIPIEGVGIIAESNGIETVSYTDNQGNFEFPNFANKLVSFRLIWQYRLNRFHIQRGSKTLAYASGPRNSSTWDLSLSGGEQNFYATIFRAGSRYLRSDFINPSNTFKDIVIKAYYNDKPPGRGSARYIALTEHMQVWSLSKTGQPFSDIRLFSYVAHEFGHADHDAFYRGGSQYLRTSLRLKESWAEAVRYFLTREEYGDSFSEVKTYSKQIPFLYGWRPNNWGRSKNYFRNYTPLMIDLIDTIHQKEVNDQVSGYTLSQFRSIMSEPKCRDFDSFKHLLKTRFNNPTEEYLDILFKEMNGR